MSIEIITEKIMGIYCIAIGLGIVIKPVKWQRLIEITKNSSSANIVLGFLATLLGAIIIIVHNSWVMKPSIITTIIGWMALLKGIILVLCPKYLFGIGDKFYKSQKGTIIVGLFAVTLGSTIFYYSL